MPLPVESTLSLIGLPAEGDALYSRPKHAMIVRMSAETFDALDQLGDSKKMEVQFGDNPGFTIGDTFFPVKPTPENAQTHELYIRLPNIPKSKGLAPLKLHANVMQKLMVQRLCDEKVQETVRDRTLEAEKERKERKVKYLDKPPDLSYPGSKGKKKDAPARRPPAASSSYAMSPRPSALQPPSHPSSSRASPLHTSHTTTSSSRSVPSGSDHASSRMSPLPASHSHTNGTSSDSRTRARLIHCLALKQRTTEAVIGLCAGKDPTSQVKNELVALLKAVGERVPMARNSNPNAPQRWQLKLDSWREVRPYEWPDLTDDERTQLSRQARKAYSDLRIPTSDPVWDHARFRSSDEPASGLSTKSTPSIRAPPEKNGVVMTKNATKKSKAAESKNKKVADIMIPAKDESSRGKARDLDESSAAGTPTTAARPAVRRQPGSGYKAKHSATPPIADVRGNSPLPPIPKKSGPVDARESRREPPAPSGSGKPQPPFPPPQARDSRPDAGAAASSSMRKKLKDGQSSSSHRPDDRRPDRRDERASERTRIDEEKPRTAKVAAASPLPPPLPSFKRKKPPQDGNDSEFSEREVPLSANSSKKRKLEEPHPSPAEKSRGRDLSLPKKPVVREPSPLAPPRTKVKQEASPLSLAFSPPHRASLPPKPPPAERSHLASASSSPNVNSTKSSQLARSSSNRPRRKSPIYTSSEDESERSVAPSRSRATQRAHSPSEEPPAKRFKSHTPRFKPGRPLPTDSAGLRRYYQTCWRVYHELYEDQDQRRKRIERMLEGNDDRAGATDDDMDVDELSPDVVVAFMEDMAAVTNELHKVRKAYEQLGGKSDALGKLVDVC
ncbi:hypothetical protein OH76DRAFT_1441121 [Lentinus brumalis]|uniref:RNA polymerase II elongation factor ELL N-terminal domain-containing protein n=1 Tax=Lentinus brumalis TaxID=2498619 RepID=A0A371D5T6_9APHY|nr:hypothetical protein OH76DRAFT_1441121 [Polyporus brumalis]